MTDLMEINCRNSNWSDKSDKNAGEVEYERGKPESNDVLAISQKHPLGPPDASLSSRVNNKNVQEWENYTRPERCQ